MADNPYQAKHSFSFSKKELWRLIIISLVAAFSVTLMKGWGFFDIIEGSSAIHYLLNLIIITVIIMVLLLIHFSIQKIIALKMGYSSEYKYWINGMIFGVLICFFSYGWVPVFFPGTLNYELIPAKRVGVFKGGVKHKDLALIAFAGPLINILLVGIITPVQLIAQNPWLVAIIAANLLIALWSLLPIPTFERFRRFEGGTTGLYILIASRWAFVLVFSTTIAFSILILLFMMPSYLLALLIGAITTIAYYSLFEMKP